jgi:hypothetical protein
MAPNEGAATFDGIELVFVRGWNVVAHENAPI